MSVIYYTNIAKKNVCSAVSVSRKIKRNTHKLIVTLGASSGKHQAEQPIARTIEGRTLESDNSYCWLTPAVPAHRAACCESRAVVRSNNVSLAKITANTTHIRS
ncbi:hypothetical protein [Microcoleus sp. B3-D7]|uniref:hypothetical protein n=1 Tax=Microcoleus sp. B3-D7 TaxID=2818659 RepID=UPI002FCFA635